MSDELPSLGLSDFPDFVREVTGFEPFPWQQRLAARVLDSGWPRLLDLPTGTGKTSTILIAVFALALAPEQASRRVVVVVDRRIIVDQIAAFAQRLSKALCKDSGVCAAVATRLAALSSDGAESSSPLRVVQLRGGVPRDDTWIGAPDQPTVIASTVDQVGSRLLFRGYGVSENMRPIHAGVLARDTLYLLDEVHLATAFEQTMRAMHDADERRAGHRRGAQIVGKPFEVVSMSATPNAQAIDDAEVFRLDAADRAHPVLRQRLQAPRPATLELVKTRANTGGDDSENRKRLVEALRRRVVEAHEAGARSIGVVVNRVATARDLADTLDPPEGEKRPVAGAEIELVTGRMRPAMRAPIYAKIASRAGAGVDGNAHEPLVVVATSCIEAGADLDFDALITEVASLDALRQRFGRLNRLGRHKEPRAWVLARKDQLGAKARPDPVYGTALRETWLYLDEIAEADRLDFGLAAFVDPPVERLATLVPPVVDAPLLFPRYLDMWSETRPAPHPDPDVSLWLHGKGQSPERDVHVVFRADIPAEVVEDTEAVASDRMEFLPPVSEEAVAVPIGSFRTWRGDRQTWRWTAAGLSRVANAGSIVPGDTLVVAATDGGLRRETWNPAADETVTDIAVPSMFRTRGVVRLRLDPATLPAALRGGLPAAASDDPDALPTAREAVEQWIEQARSAVTAEDAEDVLGWEPVLKRLAKLWSQRRRIELTADGPAGSRVWRISERAAVGDATTEDETSIFASEPITLARHLADVRDWAAEFSQRVGLREDVAADVALAGLLHDMGKADLRFQALLRGGDLISASGGEPLAKSAMDSRAVNRERARRRSGWPKGFRHELISLALLDESPQLQQRANDLELVRHLVASHHGWCRPWIPSVVDEQPEEVTVEVDGVEAKARTDAIGPALAVECASRFRRLCRRYGWHGLAYLEALLRLGDHRASRTGAS